MLTVRRRPVNTCQAQQHIYLPRNELPSSGTPGFCTGSPNICAGPKYSLVGTKWLLQLCSLYCSVDGYQAQDYQDYTAARLDYTLH